LQPITHPVCSLFLRVTVNASMYPLQDGPVLPLIALRLTVSMKNLLSLDSLEPQDFYR
jgi:hypothetical protein